MGPRWRGRAERGRGRGGAWGPGGSAGRRGVRGAPRGGGGGGGAGGRRGALVVVATGGGVIPPFLRLRHDIAPDDGWLDVLALRADGALESVTAFLALVRGPANGSRQLWFGRGREVRVEVLEGPSAPVQLDGEVTGETPFQVRLVP